MNPNKETRDIIRESRNVRIEESFEDSQEGVRELLTKYGSDELKPNENSKFTSEYGEDGVWLAAYPDRKTAFVVDVIKEEYEQIDYGSALLYFPDLKEDTSRQIDGDASLIDKVKNAITSTEMGSCAECFAQAVVEALDSKFKDVGDQSLFEAVLDLIVDGKEFEDGDLDAFADKVLDLLRRAESKTVKVVEGGTYDISDEDFVDWDFVRSEMSPVEDFEIEDIESEDFEAAPWIMALNDAKELPIEAYNDVVSAFRDKFEDADVDDDGDKVHLVLDSEEKILWAFTLWKRISGDVVQDKEDDTSDEDTGVSDDTDEYPLECIRRSKVDKKVESVREAIDLKEGQFSWFTQDTNQQIGSTESNTINVWMFDNTGQAWNESSYEGYGVFGGKDFYELVAEMNGYVKDEDTDSDQLRGIGIDLFFGDIETKNADGKILFPALVTDEHYKWEAHDFNIAPVDDPDQSWISVDEDDWEEWDNDRVGDHEIHDDGRPTVQLSGQDGNAFAVMGRVIAALKKAGYTADDIQKYRDEATSGDYEHLLQVTMNWVNVESKRCSIKNASSCRRYGLRKEQKVSDDINILDQLYRGLDEDSLDVRSLTWTADLKDAWAIDAEKGTPRVLYTTSEDDIIAQGSPDDKSYLFAGAGLIKGKEKWESWLIHDIGEIYVRSHGSWDDAKLDLEELIGVIVHEDVVYRESKRRKTDDAHR